MHWRVAFWLISGLCSGWALMVARARGGWGLGWGVLGLVLGPFGVALAYMMPMERPAIDLDRGSGAMRRCPKCVVLAPGDATECRLCGEPLQGGRGYR